VSLIKPLVIVVIAIALCASSLAFEKLDSEKERFKGRVKTVRTRTSQFDNESGEWVKDGRTVETIEEVREPNEANEEAEETNESPSERAPTDPVQDLQGKDYQAGYDDSTGDYGFYKLDERGNILETVHYAASRVLAGRDVYAYDGSGNEIDKSCYAADGSLKNRYVSSYDSRANLIEKLEYGRDQTINVRQTWTYDSSDNPVEEMLFDAGKLKYKTTYTYEYDKTGNWIKRVEIFTSFKEDVSDIQTMEVVERVITYH